MHRHLIRVDLFCYITGIEDVGGFEHWVLGVNHELQGDISSKDGLQHELDLKGGEKKRMKVELGYDTSDTTTDDNAGNHIKHPSSASSLSLSTALANVPLAEDDTVTVSVEVLSSFIPESLSWPENQIMATIINTKDQNQGISLNSGNVDPYMELVELFGPSSLTLVSMFERAGA